MSRRCFDCGGELDGGLCSACGLTPAAARIIFRRRLHLRTATFFIGAILFLLSAHAYPPLDLDRILIFVGVLFFSVLGLSIFLDRASRGTRDVQIPARIMGTLVAAPWLLAGLLWANGGLDRAPPDVRSTRVVGRFSMPGALKTSRIVVISWRLGRGVERVPVTRADFQRFQRGDAIDVRMRSGLAGIPWVEEVRAP